jgi:hypothetical protein
VDALAGRQAKAAAKMAARRAASWVANASPVDVLPIEADFWRFYRLVP